MIAPPGEHPTPARVRSLVPAASALGQIGLVHLFEEARVHPQRWPHRHTVRVLENHAFPRQALQSIRSFSQSTLKKDWGSSNIARSRLMLSRMKFGESANST